jgi:hypothetical protein
MRRIGSLIALAVWTAVAPGYAAMGTSAYLDEVDGFRDARFGMSFDAFAGLEQAESLSSNRICYTRAGDDLDVGAARLVAIKYCFQDKRLWAILFEAAGPQNTGALRRFMENSYGPGAAERAAEPDAARRLFWHGRRNHAYFAVANDEITAAARMWSSAVENEAPLAEEQRLAYRPYVDHANHDPRPPVLQGAVALDLVTPLHGHPGAVVQISLRYRNLEAPGRLRIKLPEALELQQAVPQAYEGSDAIVWGDVQARNGQVKLKARISPNAMIGRALLIKADLADSAGNHTEERETIVLQ